MKHLKKKYDFTGMTDAEIEKLQEVTLKKETRLGKSKFITGMISMGFFCLTCLFVCFSGSLNLALEILFLVTSSTAIAGYLTSAGLYLAESKQNNKYYACKNELDFRKMKEKEQEKQEEKQVETAPVAEKTAEEIKAEEKKAKEERISLLQKRLSQLQDSEKQVQEELSTLIESEEDNLTK